jgi:pseudouridine kinase
VRVHIVGPIAWDSVVETHEDFNAEMIMRPDLKHGRPGGQGLNVACALKSAGIDVILHGYVGHDEHGIALRNYMNSQGLSDEFVSIKPVSTAHVLVMIDKMGERKMTGLQKSHVKEVTIDLTSVQATDLVLWPVWFSEFQNNLDVITSVGARTAVGLRALNDVQAKAELLITSDIEEITDLAISKYSRAYISKGSGGGSLYTKREKQDIGVPMVEVIDTTGAGDAFMAGVIWGEIQDLKPLDTLHIATLWGSYATEIRSSIPPTFTQLKSRFTNYYELFQ